jgi:CO/xanthine dehydrogenase FAD-binding subunit
VVRTATAKSPRASFTRPHISRHLAPEEILTAVRIPTPATGHGYAYEKLKRKVGDYATAAAAVLLTMNGGTVASCSIALTNVADTPLFAAEASEILTGSALDRRDCEEKPSQPQKPSRNRHRTDVVLPNTARKWQA